MDDSSRSPTVLIAAAGPPRPQVLSISSKIASASMVPVNGRPIIGWILQELESAPQLTTDIVVLTPHQDRQIEDYVGRAFRKLSRSIRYLPVEDFEQPQGVAHSIYKGLEKTPHISEALIILGHTLCKDQLSCGDADFVLYGNVAEDFSRWCYVETDEQGHVARFLDKPQIGTELDKALIGIYYVTNVQHLRDCLATTLANPAHRIEGKFQLSTALDIYRRWHPIRAIQAKIWHDCGSITGIHRSKRALISSRSFNSVTVDDDFGIVTKRSQLSTKLHQEHAWYVSLPDRLKVLAPRVLGYHPSLAASSTPNGTELQLEYYGYSSLSEAWVYQNLHEGVWESILRHLLRILRLFREYRDFLPPQDFEAMYWGKTLGRLQQLQSTPRDPLWDELLSYYRLTLNRRAVIGFPEIRRCIEARHPSLYKEDHVTIIHGDFHLGNILYDVHSRLVKLVDARGAFGGAGIFGDCKYDLAKLRHSISGGYDLIVNDLFEVRRDRNSLTLELAPLPHQRQAAAFLDEHIAQEGFSVEDIKLIEGLLFLSMLPLHRDHPDRQLAMFTRAMMILNETFNPSAL